MKAKKIMKAKTKKAKLITILGLKKTIKNKYSILKTKLFTFETFNTKNRYKFIYL